MPSQFTNEMLNEQHDDNNSTTTTFIHPRKHAFVSRMDNIFDHYNHHQERRVRFSAATNQIHTIINRDDYSQEEVLSCWFSDDETSKLRATRHKTVQLMLEKNYKKTSIFSCYRGLEAWTDKGHDEMTIRIHDCKDAVMDEQDFQWRIDRDDSIRLAQCSRKASKICKLLALQIAQQDYNEAQKAYEAIDKKTKRNDGDAMSVDTCPSSPESSVTSTQSMRGSLLAGLFQSQSKKTKSSNRSSKKHVAR